MLTFLFWNMGGDSTRNGTAIAREERRCRLRAIVANLAHIHKVDLLILAECPASRDGLLNDINKKMASTANPFRPPDTKSQCQRITIFPRFQAKFMTAKAESSKYTARAIRLPTHEEILLFAAHLPSKLYKTPESQALAAPGFNTIIRELEKKQQHQRTIVVGDLNMNPFEAPLVGAEGFNAVMSRNVALKETRTQDAITHPFFYNPMWGHFGDATHESFPAGHPQHEPPGTCFYPPIESHWYYWNMYDQVLLRPGLLKCFQNRDLKILVSDREHSFVTNEGIPDRKNISDHLPILFRLNV